MESSVKSAHDFVRFVNDSPSPFHAVESAKKRLVAAGFHEIKERQNWESTCKPGGNTGCRAMVPPLLHLPSGRDGNQGTQLL